MIAIFAFVVGVTFGFAIAGIMTDWPSEPEHDPYAEPH